ncbi:HNH endonuclease [Rhodococcus sp. O3]|uniref:HNH endonuclease n=1 Tax=Rhodococcus sp. O3 TaxID=3404919 RepID=UPI003B685E67
MRRSPTAVTARTWMNTRVRVLGFAYEDFDVVPAARAIVLLTEELAITLVEHAPRFVVRSQHIAIPLPHTVQLLDYVHTPPRPVIDDDARASFRAVLERDHHRCAYCGRAGATTVDHVYPRSRGGGNSWSNWSPAAQPATTSKPTGHRRKPTCRCCGFLVLPAPTGSAGAGSGANRSQLRDLRRETQP